MKISTCLPLTSKRHLHRRLCCTVLLTGSLLSARSQPVSTSATAPGGAADVALGGGAFTWSNAAASLAVGGGTASTTGLGIVSGTSDYLELTNFGFNIPAGATITGVTAAISRSATGLALTSVKDNVVRLAGVASSNLAATGVTWPASLTTATYGSTTNLWGAGLTPAIINSPSFGLDLSVVLGGLSLAPTANVDAVTLTVTYIPPTTLGIVLQQWGVNPQDDTNVLTWTDASGATQYTIQRSGDGKDWQNVTTIAAIPGQDKYNYTDPGPFPPGPCYYRLEITGPGPTPAWSTVQVVSMQPAAGDQSRADLPSSPGAASSPTITLYPNPCRDLLNVAAAHPFTRVAVNDLRGNTLWTATFGSGTSSARIPVSDLAPGLYIVQVDGASKQLIR